MGIIHIGRSIIIFWFIILLVNASDFQECYVQCLISKVECYGVCHDNYCNPLCNFSYNGCRDDCNDVYDS